MLLRQGVLGMLVVIVVMMKLVVVMVVISHVHWTSRSHSRTSMTMGGWHPVWEHAAAAACGRHSYFGGVGVGVVNKPLFSLSDSNRAERYRIMQMKV